MPDRGVGFLCCSLLRAELDRALAQLGMEQAPRRSFGSHCHTPRGLPALSSAAVDELLGACSHVVGLCMNCRAPDADQQRCDPISALEATGFTVLEVRAQGELFLGLDATDQALTEGAFLVLPGWLRTWRSVVVDSWGFDAATAPTFFGESATRLLYLDTGCGDPLDGELEAMASFVGLPAEHRFVGVSHLEALLRCAVAERRHLDERAGAERALSRSRAQAAEYATVVDFITRLGSLPSEAEIIAALQETAGVLFAPRELAFLAPDADVPAGQAAASFSAEVAFRGEVLGVLWVCDVAMPEHQARYLPMAEAICEAAGIALNASRLLEREQRLSRELAGKVEELDQFAYVASHDLQAPLRRLVSFSELLGSASGAELPPRATTYLQHIQRNAMLMRELVQDLLRLSRAGNNPLRLEPLSLDRCLDRALQALRAGIDESGASIERGALPEVEGDAGLLSQVFQNLVGNGIKFVADGTTPHLAVAAERCDDHWAITVTDNGIGIDPAQAKTIFAPFQRLHGASQYSGSGIGLAICSRVITRHGGEIRVEPSPAGGSVFRFTLPALVPADPPTWQESP
jgi:signal transduction histidine kinase